jgi:hypothetical protein
MKIKNIKINNIAELAEDPNNNVQLKQEIKKNEMSIDDEAG